jgi:hypothetical protein
MKTDNSLWQNPSFPFRAWYRYVPWFFRNLKYAYQRACRGYSDCDVWNLDNYLAILIAESLTSLADDTVSYPVSVSSPKAWDDTLRNVAKHFSDYANQYDEESMNAFLAYLNVKKELAERHPRATEDELMMVSPALRAVKDLWIKTYEKEEQANNENIHDGLKKLADIFQSLWY